MAATESVAGGMECVVPARQVRLFSKMLVCISKISDEFTVDVSAESVLHCKLRFTLVDSQYL